MRVKYPRTYHAPWTGAAAADDKTHSAEAMVEMFAGQDVVVTEKLDGENTTIYADGTCHARSLDSGIHASRSWVKARAASLVGQIPEGWRICGENVYARHSCSYDRLSSFFFVFHIFDENGVALSWDEVVAYADMLGLETVPVVWRGTYDEAAIREAWNGVSAFGEEGEGYVIRLAGPIAYEDMTCSQAKYVRKGHVQSGAKHWSLIDWTSNEMWR